MKRITNQLLSIASVLGATLTFSVQAQTINIEQELSVLSATCPIQWESLDQQLNVGGEPDKLWQDESDYASWQTYFSGLAGNEAITEKELARIGNDHLTIASDCAAQRVKVMLLLGGTPLGDSAVAELAAQTPSSSNAEEEATIILGSRVDYPAASCLQIKDRHNDATSGYYWIKLGIGYDLLHVFCEMEHAGGGWMYWGFVGPEATPTNIFGTPPTEAEENTVTTLYPEQVTAPRSCRHIQELGGSVGDGIYQIDLTGSGEAEPVWCDMTTDGGGWTYLMHKNTGVLSDSNGSVESVYLSGTAGQASATETAEWFRTYKKCNSSDDCSALSDLHWSNPIAATELRLNSLVIGSGNTKVNGTTVVSVNDDDNRDGCDRGIEPITEIHTVSGQIAVRVIGSVKGGCSGTAQLRQVSVREPAGTIIAAQNQEEAEPAPVVENTINVGYDKHRRKTVDLAAVQSAFALSTFADSEMILALDTPSIASAKTLNKYVRYRYAENSSIFNQGPLPCTVSGGFEYSKDDESFSDASVSHCTPTYTYFREGSNYLTLFRNGLGVYWGKGMGGNNSWGHAAWIYVR